MLILGITFALLAAIQHCFIFLLESVWWGKKVSNKAFKMTPEMAEYNRTFAYNQGFYNLFLSLAIFVGAIFFYQDNSIVGFTLISYACLSIVGAGVVLLSSSRVYLRAAFIQVGPAFLAIFFLFWAKTLSP